MARTESREIGGQVVETSLRTPTGWLVLAVRTYFDLRRGHQRRQGRRFDRRLGVHTEEWDGRTATPDDGNAHQSTPPGLIRLALRAVPLSADDVVLDLGSGLGRVVFAVAQRCAVRAVIGVEANPELHRTAVRNADRCRPRLRCADVRLVHDDAAGFAIPDEVSVIYMFNPFHSATLSAVLERIEASLAENPRPLTVIYYWPVHGEMLVERGFQQSAVRPYLHLYRR
jgi:SAM-dependent methyltransferase